jgi:hypothetical protein
MKFLCIECDEAMKLVKTTDSEDGSLNVIFKCPDCGREIAMLTNSMETQMVHAMDVKIGGSNGRDEPMKKLRSSLISNKNVPSFTQKDTRSDPLRSEDVKCPFPDMISQMENQNSAASSQIQWTEGAKERIKRIPDFVREMVCKGIEKHALQNGYKEINESVMDEVKGIFGM